MLEHPSKKSYLATLEESARFVCLTYDSRLMRDKVRRLDRVRSTLTMIVVEG